MRRAGALLAALATSAAASGCAAIPAAVAVGAMAAVPGDDGSETRVQPTAEAEAVAEPVPAPPPLALQPLEPQTLAAGECGQFLFSRTEEADFVFFAPGEGAAARIRIGGADIDLARVAASGAAAFEAAEFSWTYEGGGLSARLRAASGAELPQGRRIPQASLRLTRAGTAPVVIPLTGLFACQAG